ncbi:MAG: hypothetical protein JKX85_11310 [Phycisphaeraceae bacterium]|nr:hypothetical protein [Phycisphaeraceae bacterium]
MPPGSLRQQLPPDHPLIQLPGVIHNLLRLWVPRLRL